MSFEHVTFLSGWHRPERGVIAMEGRRATLEIENTGGDFLLFEYAFPGREEERSVSVTVRVFEALVGTFRGFYSFPFYVGFRIPALPQAQLQITIETDASYFRQPAPRETKEYGLVLFHIELLNRRTDPESYQIFEAKVENAKGHFSKLLVPSAEVQPLPIALLIEPSSRCNMDCVMCARSIPGHRREEECDLSEAYLPLLERGMKGIQAARIQGLGEPLLSKQFVPLMNLLATHRVHVVTFNTNGSLLDEGMARFLAEKGKVFEHFRISFSLDAATQETYEKIRGRDLSRTLQNIRTLQAQKREGARHPLVLINMTMSRTNIADLPRFVRLARELEAEVELSHLAVDPGYESIQVKRRDGVLFDYQSEVLIRRPELYQQHLKKAKRLAKKLNVTLHIADESPREGRPRRRAWLNDLFRKGLGRPRQLNPAEQAPRGKDPFYERLPLCLLPWSQMVIGSRGDISLCCVQGPVDHLKHHASLEEAWHSEPVSQIRQQLSQGIFPPECQVADCTVRRWNKRVCIVHQ